MPQLVNREDRMWEATWGNGCENDDCPDDCDGTDCVPEPDYEQQMEDRGYEYDRTVGRWVR